ncbi:MAG: O-antigen ligase family protein, partial [Nitrospirota bacterium]
MRRTESIIFSVFIFLLIFPPLAFGAVETWSLAIIETLSLSSLILLLVRNSRSSLYRIPGIVPLCLFLFYIAFQLIPLPPPVIKAISPSTYDLYGQTLFVFEPGQWVSLSINKKATLSEFFRIASYGAFYILTIQLLAKKENFTRVLMIVATFASILSFFAILQHVLSNDKIYWIRKLTLGGALFGPYVNRNHYAGLMEMVFPLILGLFLVYKPRAAYGTLRERIIGIFNRRSTNVYLLLGFAAVLAATSIFLSLSRSGIVSLCISLIFFGSIFLLTGEDKRRGIIIIVVCLLVVLSVGWFGWKPIFERFEKIKNPAGEIAEQRLTVWKDSSNIIEDFPVLGTGFGSFQYIYPKFRTVPGAALMEHAHNDYIELLSDGGVIAAALCGWFVLAVLAASFKRFLERREKYSRYVFVAAVAGIMALLIHSVTDFNLHIGANGL